MIHVIPISVAKASEPFVATLIQVWFSKLLSGGVGDSKERTYLS